MQRVMRGHANFAEYVPLVLVLMALLEQSGRPAALLHALGLALLAARLSHGYTFAFTEKFVAGRFFGAATTLLVLGIAGFLCALYGLRAL
jgi:uncharacterized membrane protein YecN with MAPEG domain